ncbi:ACP phosphodiesterase [Flammeovirga sp. SubArs3]|uniref:acyl carrier protein phosphodiesterase n=1 Tax=Flammeovirga sp. SubArs3 TaxID=2995316 RepID=UPI00248B3B1C|nr:ACP phosphodiesterase [Flammeovirga sp. SubArs3]
MNYLAHIYLSRHDDEEMFGNFIGDFVKGRDFNYLPQKVARGVQLHRRIDEFTDHHHVTQKMKVKLQPMAGRYALVVVDIFYDHFLAKKWDHFHKNVGLQDFANHFYDLPYWQSSWTPDKAMNIYPFLKQYDWLNAYQHDEGLTKVFGGMERRINFRSPIGNAVNWLKKDYFYYEECFEDFFPQLIDFTSNVKL